MPSSTHINILFLGGSKRVSIGEVFIEAGNKHGKKVTLFSYELDYKEPIATIATIIIGRKWKDPEIYVHLTKTIKEYDIHIVIPFVDIATIICSELQPAFPEIFFCASHETINRILFDKRHSDRWFRENNFTVPAIDGPLPKIAKVNTGSGAKGIFFIKNELDLHYFNSTYQTDSYFTQQLITGDEYSVDCYVAKNENIISVVPRLRLEVINGEATRSVTTRNEEIISLTRQILIAGKFTGPVTVQFMHSNIDNKFYLLEINPRLGSGVLTSLHAGANICDFIIKDYLNIKLPIVKDWMENTIMVRAFKEFYFHAADN